MKWLRGNFWANLKGIVPSQHFSTGFLVRPLLIFSKQELIQEAKLRNLTYFEDLSNQDPSFFRNRIRQLLPEIKKENNNLITTSNRLSQQINAAQTLIQEDFIQWQNGDNNLDLTRFKKLSEMRQYLYLIEFFWQQQIVVKASLIEQIWERLKSTNHLNWECHLGGRLFFVCKFRWAYFEKREFSGIVDASEYFELSLGERIKLADQQILAFGNSSIEVGDEICETYFTASSKIKIRHPQKGDRLQLTVNLKKRLSRIFIDEKIPLWQRQKFWVIEDEQGILFLPKFKYAYFSKEDNEEKRRIFLIDAKSGH
jgi:tRNA(Ile)-lysidine synthase